MSHLETLIVEYLDWEGFLVKKNIKVGRLNHGGWEMELDVIGYHPIQKKLVHYEPSIDADSWKKREERYAKKFEAGRNYIFEHVFPWLDKKTGIEQYAVFSSHPKDRDEIAGGKIISIDEFVKGVRDRVLKQGIMGKKAIPEQFPLLRTMQISHCGYYKVL